jgi:predicted outer membrane repeat protein
MSRKRFTGLVVILILSAQALFTVTPVQAAAITVTSKLDTSDPGKCRLRDAITAANTNTATGGCPAGSIGLDTIGFSLGTQCNLTLCTISLTNALPAVTEDLTINGNNTAISGANAFRVFELNAVTVNISNLKISNGNAFGPGGAIAMAGTPNPGTLLTLTNVFFSGNHAVFGGAIYEDGGTLSVQNCTFSGNTASGNGGAIYQTGNVPLLFMIASTLSNNTAAGEGGALALEGEATILTSTFSGNSAGSGGAIAKSVGGNFFLDNSVVDHNSSTPPTSVGGGGGIIINANRGTTTLTNVTVSGNSTKNDGGGILAIIQAPLNLNNVTITNNTADSDNNGIGNGGGISMINPSPHTVQNSIIAGNFDTPGNTGGGIVDPDCAGTFTSQGYNLIGRKDGCGGFVNGTNGDQVGTGASPIDPLLALLANNGGRTQTHALLPGSPAINAGNPLPPGSGGFACALTDQRNIGRPVGSACDMGAFEFVFRSMYLPLVLR